MSHMNPVFTAQTNEAVLNIYYDEYADSPREFDEGIISHFYIAEQARSKIDAISPQVELLEKIAKTLRIRNPQNLTQFELIDRIAKKDPDQKYIVIEPLYKYEHSGIVYATTPFSCPWDSGQVGYIFTTKLDFKRVGLKWDVEVAKNNIESEIKVVNQYLAGSCFCFNLNKITTCGNCEHTHFEVIESCSGFLGDLDEIRNIIATDFLSDNPELQKMVMTSLAS